MKALDFKLHQTNLTNILLDIYRSSALGPYLGFKGGTAARLFYRLPRFSVDLDFDLLSPLTANSAAIKKLANYMDRLLTAKYQILDQHHKYTTLFWLVSYAAGRTNIKLEISLRTNPYNHYAAKPFYGATVKVLKLTDMIAHKLVAITDRKTAANRDLFDARYFLGLPEAGKINYQIIKERTGKTPKQFFGNLENFLKKLKRKNILTGLGEVLTQPQKDNVKATLIPELIGLVQRQKNLF